MKFGDGDWMGRTASAWGAAKILPIAFFGLAAAAPRSQLFFLVNNFTGRSAGMIYMVRYRDALGLREGREIQFSLSAGGGTLRSGMFETWICNGAGERAVRECSDGKKKQGKFGRG